MLYYYAYIRERKIERSTSGTCGTIWNSLKHVIGVPEEKVRRGQKKLFEEIMAKTSYISWKT